MNQILNSNISEISEEQEPNNFSNTHSSFLFFKIVFFISSIIAVCFTTFFFYRLFRINQNSKISQKLISDYQVSTLYSNSTTYSAKQVTSSSSNNSDSDPFVIGMIKIDKIGLTYPILSETNKELLDISVCRFAGPMPNTVGNLCIAGHNYVDYKFFSRLNELTNNDIVKIYDLSGNMVEYTITNMYEVKSNDLSCTNQNTNGKLIVTLLTCNNVSGNRLIVRCEKK
mgnify:FL=1